MTRKQGLRLFLLLLLVGLLAACGSQGDAPEEVAAMDYFRAVMTNNDDYLSTHICEVVPEGTGSQELLALWSIGLALKASPTFGEEDLKVDMIARRVGGSEGVAEVQMRGTITYPEMLEAGEHLPLPRDTTVHFEEVWYMVQPEGQDVWQWCGSKVTP